MGIFRWIFRRKKNEVVQQSVGKPQKIPHQGRSMSNSISAKLGVISNQLSNLGEEAKAASRIEEVKNVRRDLYKAKRNVQVAIGKLK